jgi:hypothetical protein
MSIHAWSKAAEADPQIRPAAIQQNVQMMSRRRNRSR